MLTEDNVIQILGTGLLATMSVSAVAGSYWIANKEERKVAGYMKIHRNFATNYARCQAKLAISSGSIKEHAPKKFYSNTVNIFFRKVTNYFIGC